MTTDPEVVSVCLLLKSLRELATECSYLRERHGPACECLLCNEIIGLADVAADSREVVQAYLETRYASK